jgi:NIMA-interacting peptidyl-prolyl cis-trans isomerase 1
LPDGWTIRKSKTHNREYFFHEATKESQWEPPAGTDLEQLDKYKNQPKKVRASHLLIKHNGSRRPASWKSDKITRSREEAIEILQGHLRRIQAGEATLSEIAQTESDCSSAKRGGDLGFFERGQMQPPFEKATFDLDINEISGIVETDSGVHIIQRTG